MAELLKGSNPGNAEQSGRKTGRLPTGHLPTGRWVYSFGWLAMFWENLWPLLVRPLIVALAFLIVSWFGLWPHLPGLARWLVVAGFAIGFFISLWPLRRFCLPERSAVIRRIEKSSKLQHRPITAARDRMALGEAQVGKILWQEHQARLSANMKDLSCGMAKPDATRMDQWALRGMLAVLAVAAFAFSLGSHGGSVAQAFRNHVDKQELRSRFDAWVNPPAYTRKPPLYLTRAGSTSDDAEKKLAAVKENPEQSQSAPLNVPVDSDFFLRFVGAGNVTLWLVDGEQKHMLEPVKPDAASDKADAMEKAAGGAAEPADRKAESGESETEFALSIEKPVTLAVEVDGTQIDRWTFDVTDDTPPVISFAEEPSAALSSSLQLTYNLADDYGVSSARGEVKPLEAGRADARPLVGAPELDLPLPSSRVKKGVGRVNLDLTRHPWAGSQVELTLLARDDRGQEGRSESRKIVLPARQFSNQLSLAIIEQRRNLALDANQAPAVAGMIGVFNNYPEELGKPATIMALAAVHRQIRLARSDDDLRDVLDQLWEIALGIEYGDLGDVERRLREAQEQLSKALEDGASDEEIEKRMAELRQAMDEFMRKMMEQAMRNPMDRNMAMQSPNTRTLRQQDLEKMMDQIENLAKSGSRDAARQMLSELQRMMDNLQMGRGQQQMARNPTNQALDQLSELMRKQQQLMDETAQLKNRMQENRRNGQQQQNDQNAPNGKSGRQQQNGNQQRQSNGERKGGQEQADSSTLEERLRELQDEQQALQEQLSELEKALEGLGMDTKEGFGEANQEMGSAEKNIGEGKPGEATDNQANALDALRRGAQSMMEQLAEQGDGQGQGQQGQAGNRQRGNDPLGRGPGENGMQADTNARVPDEVDAQRAREIMDAIRKRLEDPLKPLFERDYLERLLKKQ